MKSFSYVYIKQFISKNLNSC